MILKKQLHLDIETIYIMFFEGFLGDKLGFRKIINGNTAQGGVPIFLGKNYGVFIIIDVQLAIVDIVLNAYNKNVILGHVSPLEDRQYTYETKNTNELYCTLNNNAGSDGIVFAFKISA